MCSVNKQQATALLHTPGRPAELRTQHSPLVMVRKRSCPAVSQICSFTHLPSISTFFSLKSMPIVVMKLHLAWDQKSGQAESFQGPGRAGRGSPLGPGCSPQPCPAYPAAGSSPAPRRERVLCKPHEQAALPHACAAHQAVAVEAAPAPNTCASASAARPRFRGAAAASRTPCRAAPSGTSPSCSTAGCPATIKRVQCRGAGGRLTRVPNQEELDQHVVAIPFPGHTAGCRRCGARERPSAASSGVI